jgi:hypothetical protein
MSSVRPLIDIDTFFTDLKERGIKHLHHANSVETAITYFRYALILSRQKCEADGLPQSPQWSDDLDKKFGIWNDIFLNANDFHQLFKKPNKYGPILFCFNLDRLRDHLKANGAGLSITKDQPHEWTEDNSGSRWRVNTNDFFQHPKDHKLCRYTNGWPDVVISIDSGQLPLDLVDRVIIDEHPTSDLFHSQTRSIFENCMKSHGIEISVFKRKFCKDVCKCKNTDYFKKETESHKYVTGSWESEYGSVG